MESFSVRAFWESLQYIFVTCKIILMDLLAVEITGHDVIEE